MSKMKFQFYCYYTFIVLFFTGMVSGIVMISCNPDVNLPDNTNPNTSGTPDGTPDTSPRVIDPTQAIEIRTPADLQLLASYPTSTFHIMNDIDMQGISFTPIPSFGGTIEGRKHKIKNLKVQFDSTNQGSMQNFSMFILSTSGKVTINELEFEDAELKVLLNTLHGGIQGGNVGGIIGKVEHDTTITQLALDEVKIISSINAGGVAGRVYSVDFLMENCSIVVHLSRPDTTTAPRFAGIINQANNHFTIKNTYIGGTQNNAGGYPGDGKGGFDYDKNAVVGSSIRQSGSPGVPSLHNIYWFIITNTNPASYTTSSFDGTTSIKSIGNSLDPTDTNTVTINGEVKVLEDTTWGATADGPMQVQANFKNWDFVNIWTMGHDFRGYPKLQWE